jgi:molybdopterin molybdotransferase
VRAVAEIAKGRNVGRIGEDIQAGETVLHKGRVLRPQDVGVLSSIGVAGVAVRRQPRVALVVTGNELLAAGETPHGCRIADANGPMLAALTARDGGELLPGAIVPDEREAIHRAMRADADVVLVSGGSSCGQEDHAPSILSSEGDLAIHGISMKPARPTGMGTLGDRIVFLLPGNPVACLFAYDLFAGRAMRVLGGRPSNWPYRLVPARLSRDIKSEVGRIDYLRVRIVEHDKSDDGKEPTLIEPVPQSGASVLSSTVRADGFVLVPTERAASAAGEDVSLYLYDADL